MYNRGYYEANRDRINQRHRDNYTKHRERRNARRREEYQHNRESILQRQKTDRVTCPLCHLTFRRLYVPRHVALRHNKGPPQAAAGQHGLCTPRPASDVQSDT